MPDLDRRRLLTCLASLPAAPWSAARASPGREAPPPLQLAQDAGADVDPAGFLVSEKFDGVRGFWDGTALRFRSGRAVVAPRWFTARLPATALDGELWLGRGRFEALSAAVRRSAPADAEWREIRYLLFDLPGAAGRFDVRAGRLADIVRQAVWPALQVVEQSVVADRAALQRRLDAVVRGGGEGLMLHRAAAPHVAGRSADLLKLKPQHDAEAVVIGHTAGRGRHAGRLGALQVRNERGVEFLVGTGFSDAERESPPPVGSIVTYSHRGTTAAGVPRFAGFLRRREP